jgi:Ca2+-binding EF-hand superfamily protein
MRFNSQLRTLYCVLTTVDFDTFVKIVHRPDGFKSLGEPEDYIRGFQVFDKDHTGYIGVGELRYSR